jgi:hypothetical protein
MVAATLSKRYQQDELFREVVNPKKGSFHLTNEQVRLETSENKRKGCCH